MTVKKSVHPFYERLSLVLIGLIALGYLIIQGKEILDPLIFGFLFAIMEFLIFVKPNSSLTHSNGMP